VPGFVPAPHSPSAVPVAILVVFAIAAWRCSVSKNAQARHQSTAKLARRRTMIIAGARVR
jgi:hypothetical protein